MPGTILFLAIGLAVVVVAVVVYSLILSRGRELGTRGVVQRSHLRCPKCQQEFDYDWVPGASFTAIRLGPSRYMSCPLCRRWSTFDLYGNLVARTPSPSSGGHHPPGPPEP